jgi:hypothetical protein
MAATIALDTIGPMPGTLSDGLAVMQGLLQCIEHQACVR